MAPPAGFTALTALRIQDATGRLLPAGTLLITPTDGDDIPLQASAGGIGGLIHTEAAELEIVNGALAPGLAVADTALTHPTNLCYRFTVLDPDGQELVTVRQQQPTGPSFSLDTDVRHSVPPQAIAYKGPQGDPGVQGVPGVQGPAGIVTAGSVSGNPFLITGKTQRTANLTTVSALSSDPQTEQDQESVLTTVSGPGISLGNNGGWTVTHGHAHTMVTSTRGIAQMILLEHHISSTGDKALIYGYSRHTGGGISGQSDEGPTGINMEMSESATYFKGSVVVAPGADHRTPTLTGTDIITDGAFLLNISRGTLAGNLTGPSVPLIGLASDGTPLGPPVNQLPVSVTAGGASLPLTTAWGSCGAIAGCEATRDQVYSVTRIFKLGQIQGVAKPFTAGYAVLKSSWFPEQVLITGFGDVVTLENGAATQSVTFNCSNPSGSAYLFQGGPAGQYLSFDGNLAFSGMRSSYFAFGSLDGTHLIYGMNAGGGSFNDTTLPMLGDEAATWVAPAPGKPDYRGWHLFPGAEVVLADTVSAGLTPMLEQNPWTWAMGDLVECPHYPVTGGHVAWFTKVQVTPTNPSFGSKSLELTYGGPGIGQSYQPVRLDNQNPKGWYKPWGGPLGTPPAQHVRGPHSTFATLERFPSTAIVDILGVDQDDPTVGTYLAYQQGPQLQYDIANNRMGFPQPPFLPGFVTRGSDGHLYFIQWSGTAFVGTLVS